jgi:hypothetical protein
MTADPDMLGARMEHLVELLQGASAGERSLLECAVRTVARAQEALLQARRHQQNASARLKIARTTTHRAMADTARLRVELQIIRNHTLKQ